MSWIVVRYPCLPEDEGRTHLLTSVATKDEAEEYIRGYTADGYFSRGNLGIIETPEKE